MAGLTGRSGAKRRIAWALALAARFELGALKAFELAFCPIQRLFHRLAPEVAHDHLGHDRLVPDLGGD
jgi:hypothetical protein